MAGPKTETLPEEVEDVVAAAIDAAPYDDRPESEEERAAVAEARAEPDGFVPLLVGGHAVAGHAEPRFTEDLDVFVEPSLANGKRLRAALIAFGFGEAAPPPNVLAIPDEVFMLGRKPTRIEGTRRSRVCRVSSFG